jgi:hypothetical protein
VERALRRHARPSALHWRLATTGVIHSHSLVEDARSLIAQEANHTAQPSRGVSGSDWSNNWLWLTDDLGFQSIGKPSALVFGLSA